LIFWVREGCSAQPEYLHEPRGTPTAAPRRERARGWEMWRLALRNATCIYEYSSPTAAIKQTKQKMYTAMRGRQPQCARRMLLSPRSHPLECDARNLVGRNCRSLIC
jgi:hypothetical protein